MLKLGMFFYAIQVRTGRENKFIEQAENELSNFNIDFFALKRKLMIKKNGVVKEKVLPVFPGYVFCEVDNFSVDLQRKVRRIGGFQRTLPSTMEPEPIADNDLDIIRHFKSFGGLAEISSVVFDENDRIVITSGPLKNFEGKIVKVDKRKGRAKVILDMYNQSYTIDFGFQVIKRQD